MKFNVGDKVRCIQQSKSGDSIIDPGAILTVRGQYLLSFFTSVEKEGEFSQECFELVEQPEPQVGDVWGSENKKEVVKMVGEFFSGDGSACLSYVHIKGDRKGRTWERSKSEIQKAYPLLLHRPPKKQPKPQPKQPKKQEEVWERIFQSNEDYRCGNKIKVIYQGYEGLAVCNKHDKFDLMFGVNLAAHRAMVKYHQNVIDEMMKEGAK